MELTKNQTEVSHFQKTALRQKKRVVWATLIISANNLIPNHSFNYCGARGLKFFHTQNILRWLLLDRPKIWTSI